MNQIAKLNDQFRSRGRFGQPSSGAPEVPGTMFLTMGVATLPRAVQFEIWAKVQTFSDFSEGNDPYGERDFGAFDIGGKKIFWKIDYYADKTLSAGSEDPADPEKCFRVLTVMLAEEY
jgi:hypothetical protein